MLVTLACTEENNFFLKVDLFYFMPSLARHPENSQRAGLHSLPPREAMVSGLNFMGFADIEKL